jgi:hypothetical protein
MKRRVTLRLAYMMALGALPILLEALAPAGAQATEAPRLVLEQATHAAAGPREKDTVNLVADHQSQDCDLELLDLAWRFELSYARKAEAAPEAPRTSPCAARVPEVRLLGLLPPGTGPPAMDSG